MNVRVLTIVVAAAACAGRPPVAPRPSPTAVAGLTAAELIVLLDRARLGRDDAALAELWKELALGGAPVRGLDATRRVLAALAPRAAGDADAAALVRADAALLDPQVAMLAPTRELRAVVRGGGPLAASAALRLHAVCAEALREAASLAGTAAKVVAANRCLYAAQDADPAPYFAADAAARPPDPPWTLLSARSRALLEAIPATHPLAVLARRRLDEERAFLESAARSLPAPVTPRTLALPIVEGGLPYDRLPLLQVAPGGMRIDGVELGFDDGKTLSTILAEDRRLRVTLVAPGQIEWWRVHEALKLARRAGAVVAELGVAEMVRATVPAGDVHAGEQPLLRIAGFPVTLYTLVPGESAPPLPRDLPRGSTYGGDVGDGALARIAIGAAGTRLVTDGGPQTGDAVEALRAVKDLRGVRLAAAPDVPYMRVLAEIARVYAVAPAIGLEGYAAP
ncbi:MAG: hypothetical protein AABZ30_09785 [Myxococcota bacterium]